MLEQPTKVVLRTSFVKTPLTPATGTNSANSEEVRFRFGLAEKNFHNFFQFEKKKTDYVLSDSDSEDDQGLSLAGRVVGGTRNNAGTVIRAVNSVLGVCSLFEKRIQKKLISTNTLVDDSKVGRTR